MPETDPRAMLARLIEERGEDYAGLSRLIGRNAAYMQQYIKRGVPKRLAEGDRRLLARYFGIAEEVLGGPAATASPEVRQVPSLAIGASAGPGALPGQGEGEARSFDARWLRRLAADPKGLSMIRVEGDSMVPTLADGDEILVDCGDGADRLRDGIYVLRRDDALLVKRLAPSPAGKSVSVRSDNSAYPSWPDCALKDIEIVGRVVWVGRKLG